MSLTLVERHTFRSTVLCAIIILSVYMNLTIRLTVSLLNSLILIILVVASCSPLCKYLVESNFTRIFGPAYPEVSITDGCKHRRLRAYDRFMDFELLSLALENRPSPRTQNLDVAGIVEVQMPPAAVGEYVVEVDGGRMHPGMFVGDVGSEDYTVGIV